jgi:hypothetical protein
MLYDLKACFPIAHRLSLECDRSGLTQMICPLFKSAGDAGLVKSTQQYSTPKRSG